MEFWEVTPVETTANPSNMEVFESTKEPRPETLNLRAWFDPDQSLTAHDPRSAHEDCSRPASSAAVQDCGLRPVVVQTSGNRIGRKLHVLRRRMCRSTPHSEGLRNGTAARHDSPGAHPSNRSGPRSRGYPKRRARRTNHADGESRRRYVTGP